MTNLTLNRFDSDWWWWRRQRQRQPNTVFIYKCSNFAIIFSPFRSPKNKLNLYCFRFKCRVISIFHFNFVLLHQLVLFFWINLNYIWTLFRRRRRRRRRRNERPIRILTMASSHFKRWNEYALARCAYAIRIHHSSIVLSCIVRVCV